MIAFIRGEVEDIYEDNVIIDTGTLGYNVRISGRTAEQLSAGQGEVKLYTYTCVREDAFLLYGFLSKDELDIFKQLITVNGLGPKGGLAILSVMSTDDLRFAIMAGDAKAIAKAPGVGAKTASRIILDLKDKIHIEDTLIQKDIDNNAGYAVTESQARNEAAEALIALGYSPQDALRAIKKAAPSADADTEMILKLALKNMF